MTDDDRNLFELITKLRPHVLALTEMGENDMGWLTQRLAERFHTGTQRLQHLLTELQESVAWPHEPDDFGGAS